MEIPRAITYGTEACVSVSPGGFIASCQHPAAFTAITDVASLSAAFKFH